MRVFLLWDLFFSSTLRSANHAHELRSSFSNYYGKQLLLNRKFIELVTQVPSSELRLSNNCLTSTVYALLSQTKNFIRNILVVVLN